MQWFSCNNFGYKKEKYVYELKDSGWPVNEYTEQDTGTEYIYVLYSQHADKLQLFAVINKVNKLRLRPSQLDARPKGFRH